MVRSIIVPAVILEFDDLFNIAPIDAATIQAAVNNRYKYFAFDCWLHIQIADAAKMIVKSDRALVARARAARACSSSAASTCLGRLSIICFMATSLFRMFIYRIDEMRPNPCWPAIKAIKYFKGNSKGKTRSGLPEGGIVISCALLSATSYR